MPVWCYSCKSWNCEENGYDAKCCGIIENMLLTKIPDELISNIYQYISYDDEKDEEDDGLVECIKCHIRRDAPKDYLLCSTCYKEYGCINLKTKSKNLKEFLNPLPKGKCLIKF